MEKTRKVTIEIEGMHCASCASNIERSLSKISGVSNIKVSVLMGKAFADCSQKVKEKDLSEAVAKTGFKVRGIVFD